MLPQFLEFCYSMVMQAFYHRLYGYNYSSTCSYQQYDDVRLVTGLLLRNLVSRGNPRSPLQGSFKGVLDMGIDVDM